MIILSNVVNCFSKLLTLHSQGELCSLSSLWMKSDGVTINMKATELYFPFLLFIMLYRMVLAFQSVDEIL